MTATFLFGETELDRREAEVDKDERGDDPTPRELVREIISAAAWPLLAGVTLSRPTRVLDVCAGYGVWASEWRRWWEREAAPCQVQITGCEIFGPRRGHLRKWCDRVLIGDYLEHIRDEHFDAVIGNPKFALLVSDEGPDVSMPARLLEVAPKVLLLHQTTNLQRGRAGVAVWRAYKPARVWLVPGSVGFRGPGGGSDSRCYQASLWRRGDIGPTIVEMLPGPPGGGASWRWTVPPGSEEPSEDLPAAPGWSTAGESDDDDRGRR